MVVIVSSIIEQKMVTGSLFIIAKNKLSLQTQDSGGTIKDALIARVDGATELYHNDSKKFETTEQGVGIAGSITVDNDLLVSGVSTFQGNINLGDDDQIVFGDGGFDLDIYHSGQSYIRDNGSGNLRLETNGAAVQKILCFWRSCYFHKKWFK